MTPIKVYCNGTPGKLIYHAGSMCQCSVCGKIIAYEVDFWYTHQIRHEGVYTQPWLFPEHQRREEHVS